MFDINDFVETMNEVVLNAEENDVGMWELVDIAANYIDEKLGGKKMKKVYSLKEKDEFIKAAESIMFEALDEEREVPIKISVGDVVIELPMCADFWNEIDFSLRECYEVEYGELAQTTGNTKITSAGLIHSYFTKELSKINKDNRLSTLKRLVRIGCDDLLLSDVAECIRIENDLRNSEVKCLYDDFEADKITDIVAEEFNQFCMSKFEYTTSKDNKYDFLLFFGRDLENGEVVGFDIHRDCQDWIDAEWETIDNYWNELNN